jgi:hypothetical protein
MSNNQGVEPTSPSRRSVVKGAAWAVPAVVVAGAAPAMAASQCLTASFSGLSCKWPGGGQNNFGYQLQICFTNNCDVEATITVKSIQGNAASSPVFDINPDRVVVVAPGATVCLPPPFIIYCSKNSNNFIDITVSVNGGADQVLRAPSPPRDCLGPDQCNP